MSQEKKEPEEILVVDKRRFTSEGEIRPEAEANKASELPPSPRPTPRSEPQAAPAPEKQATRAAREAYERQAGPAPPQKADFETLILSLSTSAMYQLGMVQDRSGAQIPVDREAARQTIDILGVIQQKTRGNLTPQEDQLLDQVLYELRLAFVQLSSGQSGAPKSKKGS
jgi:hypothetical protein